MCDTLKEPGGSQKKRKKNKPQNQRQKVRNKKKEKPFFCVFSEFGVNLKALDSILISTLSSHSNTMPIPRWSSNLVASEPVILTIHQNGVPNGQELAGHQYQVNFVNGVFQGFIDPADGTSYSTASALCCAKLRRNGPKSTNEWRGPRHCLVLRGGSWIPVGNL